MTQEQKQLLLKDLCARLPYGIKCKDQYGDYINVNIYNAHIEHLINQIVSGVVQMILRPMLSMTEEERKEYCQLADSRVFNIFVNPRHELIDWLNTHHFDYRGLIDKGLALVALEGIYNIKEK